MRSDLTAAEALAAILEATPVMAPETASVRDALGRVLAAKLIGTGALLHTSNKTLLSLRLIDTETTAVAKVFSRPLAEPATLETDIAQLDREILELIIKKYPLRGYIVQVEGDRVMLNLGARHGIVPGTRFQAVREGKKIKYKGKELRGKPQPFADMQIDEAGPDVSFARVITSDGPLERDDKVLEKMQEIADSGG